MILEQTTIVGTVKKGRNQGKNLGAATANLDLKLAKKINRGLYAAEILYHQITRPGLVYYGYNSLSQKDCLEVHIVDFNDNLYGKKITITLKKFLRPEIKFETAAALKKQIALDLINFKKTL